MRKLAIIIVLLLSPIYILAETHYVSKSGSDEYPYTSWATAADSIQKGINASSPGDTVRVGSGTYRETIVMIAGISLLGAGFDSTLIYPRYRSVRDIVFGADSSVIEGFCIRGWQPGQMEFCTGIRSAIDSKLKKISNNKIINCDDGIYMDASSTIVSNDIIMYNDAGIDLFYSPSYSQLIINNTIQQNTRGIMFLHAGAPRFIKNIISDIDYETIHGDFLDSILIENNLVVNIPGDIAIYLDKLSHDLVNAPIRNNTISASQGYAIISVEFSSEIKNNILTNGNCGVDAYRPNGYACNPKVSFNDVWNVVQPYSTENGATIDTSSGGNIYKDPMFVGSDNYHLQYASPCINAGDPNIKDPDSSRSDIGCYGGAYGETYTYLDYPPKPPDSLSAVSESTATILSWKPNTESDLSHYLVYKDTISGFIPDTFKIVGNIPKDSSIFRDYDFVLGKIYYYRLSAWDLTGHQSEYSDELEVKATSVDDYTEEENRPPMYQLYQNYPNPFNSETVIWYYLPDVGYQPAEVEITIYNLLGGKVKSLVNGREYPGEHRVSWNGKDDSGKEVASGIYFYRLKVSGLALVKAKKMVILK
jgi:nitrous oxidase accessory protein NosD